MAVGRPAFVGFASDFVDFANPNCGGLAVSPQAGGDRAPQNVEGNRHDRQSFAGGKFSLVGIDEAAANAARLLKAARASGDLVVHVRHEFPGANPPFFAAGSDGAAIHPSVVNQDQEAVVLKNDVNAFRETDLEAILGANDVTEITIAGAMSHMCVDAITRAAVDLGYKVTVIHDAVATRELSFNGVTVPAALVHAAFMAALSFAYADVVSTDDYLADAAAASTAA